MLCFDDQKIITLQLGRHSHHVMEISARCPAGHPAVVKCYPLQRNGSRVSPFPTLYWLTCPTLSSQLAHLERDGAIVKIENELLLDEAMQKMLSQNHEDYIAQRWAALTPEDQHFIEKSSFAEDYHQRGIGGMANRLAVKCLHLHMAQHLVGGNVIGALIAARYGVKPCEAVTTKS